ncbi:MAG TPA: Uma2 family endonuclease [Fimbriiglobus sp.]|jgi:Uma2 family endonuclease|nr:Uma2 family endonuclease [Fimbriiglobus sp.]
MSSATVQPATYGHDASFPRFSVARYQKMIETGVLDVNDRVELLENYMVLKMARNPLHDSTIQRSQRVLFQIVPNGWDVRIQSAVALADSQPEPDFAFVRGTGADYETRHPGPVDVGLLIEVADSSLLRDRQDKTRIYARAGIPVYWVVNLVDRKVEVFSDPDQAANPPAYRSRQAYGPGDQVPLVLDGAAVGSVPAADLLP